MPDEYEKQECWRRDARDFILDGVRSWKAIVSGATLVIVAGLLSLVGVQFPVWAVWTPVWGLFIPLAAFQAFCAERRRSEGRLEAERESGRRSAAKAQQEAEGLKNNLEDTRAELKKLIDHPIEVSVVFGRITLLTVRVINHGCQEERIHRIILWVIESSDKQTSFANHRKSATMPCVLPPRARVDAEFMISLGTLLCYGAKEYWACVELESGKMIESERSVPRFMAFLDDDTRRAEAGVSLFECP